MFRRRARSALSGRWLAANRSLATLGMTALNYKYEEGVNELPAGSSLTPSSLFTGVQSSSRGSARGGDEGSVSL
jgi:hypothetical protein